MCIGMQQDTIVSLEQVEVLPNFLVLGHHFD